MAVVELQVLLLERFARVDDGSFGLMRAPFPKIAELRSARPLLQQLDHRAA